MNNIPAFPTMNAEYGGEQDGMTLRDYFAAKAMQGFLSSKAFYDMESCASASYEVADLMMKERK